MTWYTVADNGLVFCRVGSNGNIQTNPNPDDPTYLWNNETSGVSEDLYGITWNGSYFVTCGANGTLIYSADGNTWLPNLGGVPAVNLNDIASLSNVVIAVGDSGTIIVSQWGGFWQTIPSGTTEHLRGVAVGDSAYIAVGDNDAVVTGTLVSYDPQAAIYDGFRLNDPLFSDGTFSLTPVSDDLWIYDSEFIYEHLQNGSGTTDDSSSTSLDVVVTEDLVASETTGNQLNEDTTVEIGGDQFASIVEVFEMAETGTVIGETGSIDDGVVDTGATRAAAGSIDIDSLGFANGGTTASSTNAYHRIVSEDLGVNESVLNAASGVGSTNAYNFIQRSYLAVDELGTEASMAMSSSAIENFTASTAIGAADFAAIADAIGVTDSRPFEYLTIISEQTGDTYVIEEEEAAVWVALGAFITENLVFDEPANAESMAFSIQETEVFTLDDVPTTALTFGAILAEDLSFDDTPTINQVLNLLLSEQAIFTTGFTFLGESYRGVIMNLRNKAITEYDSYDFNSMGYWNGTAFGTKSDGVYRLEGADDAGVDIAAHILTAITNFGNPVSSRVERAYLGIRNDGTLTLKVIARQDDDTKVAHLYDLTEVGSTLRRERVKLGKGVRAAYFQFELSNSAGADFEMDEMVLVPIALARRIT